MRSGRCKSFSMLLQSHMYNLNLVFINTKAQYNFNKKTVSFFPPSWGTLENILNIRYRDITRRLYNILLWNSAYVANTFRTSAFCCFLGNKLDLHYQSVTYTCYIPYGLLCSFLDDFFNKYLSSFYGNKFYIYIHDKYLPLREMTLSCLLHLLGLAM